MGFTYTPTIPQPGDFPSNSQSQILNNFQYLIGAAGKGLLHDHNMTLSTANADDGAHKQVTFDANLGGTPGFAGASSVLYPALANGQSQLYFNNGGANTQMTVVTATIPAYAVGPPSSGVSFLPGGFLLQWGQASGKALASVITFNVAFSATAYSITLTPYNSAYEGTSHGAPSAIGATATQFQIGNGTGQATTYNLYWMAIGPA